MYAAEAAYFAAGGPGRASFTTLAPFFADDVVLHQAEGMPYGGIWRGHAGLERFFATTVLLGHQGNRRGLHDGALTQPFNRNTASTRR
ncbi:hypothetical protein FB390_1571 [Nocardia bhagyanarayanae]|uniref:SnoaL-like protein n=2 Tax=Nocardia bhagyanarayanae TaxID=1215925 RepID=A0A543F7Y9_9NOCA|nr:hypothetical protein FB390_1571 [Nocardia bhagyanarayanae]